MRCKLQSPQGLSGHPQLPGRPCCMQRRPRASQAHRCFPAPDPTRKKMHSELTTSSMPNHTKIAVCLLYTQIFSAKTDRVTGSNVDNEQQQANIRSPQGTCGKKGFAERTHLQSLLLKVLEQGRLEASLEAIAVEPEQALPAILVPGRSIVRSILSELIIHAGVGTIS